MVVVGPLPAVCELIGELWTETQLMDLVGHCVSLCLWEIRIKVVI